MMKFVLILLCGAVFCSGCASTNPRQNAQRVGGGMALAGAAGGALVGNAIKKGSPTAIAAGTVAGLGAGALAGAAYSNGVNGAYDEGYVQGQSDNIKRTWWILQNARVGNQQEGQGRRVFYTVPAATETEDGRKQVPHTVTVPIIE